MRPIVQTRKTFRVRLRRSRREPACYTDNITDEDATVETLRVRYAELLRLRRYVQRLEGLCHDAAGPRERRARRANMERESPAAERISQYDRRIRQR